MESVDVILWFVFTGALGGFTHALVSSKSAKDLLKFESLKQIVLGVICGFIYCMLWSDYNFPNGIMSLVSGYAGSDFIVRLVAKYRNP